MDIDTVSAKGINQTSDRKAKRNNKSNLPVLIFGFNI